MRWYAHMMSALRGMGLAKFRPNERRLRGFGTGKGEGVKNLENLADFICAWPLILPTYPAFFPSLPFSTNSRNLNCMQGLPRAVPGREGEPGGGEREVRRAAPGRGAPRRQDRRQQDQEALRLLPRAAARPQTIDDLAIITTCRPRSSGQRQYGMEKCP